MGHSVVTHERINKQLNYEGYGLIRYHFCRLPVEHDRGSASLPPGPHLYRRLHHCRRSRPDLCCWNRDHHPHRHPGPRCPGCQEIGSAQDPCSSGIDGIFFHFYSFKSKSKTKIRNKKKKKKKKKKKTPKKKKKKKKKK